jgi:hypothetical protein
MPPLIPPSTVAEAVVTFARDDTLSGRVMVLPGGESRQLI